MIDQYRGAKYPSRAEQWCKADEYASRIKVHNPTATRDAWLSGYAQALRDRAAVDRANPQPPSDPPSPPVSAARD